MDEQGLSRPAAHSMSRRRPPAPARERIASSLAERPDRVALWAVALAVVAMIAGAASAQAGSTGGASPGGDGTGAPGETSEACPVSQLGERVLRLGACGEDVATLNWILASQDYRQVPLEERFEAGTELAVRGFEREAGIAADGVAEEEAVAALVNAMPSQLATWYGPGLWGNRTACGQTLERDTVGVAHRTLPCGSRVVLRYRGRYLRTRVIDRGPYASGAKWDLTQRAARLVGFESTDEIRVAKLGRGAKRR